MMLSLYRSPVSSPADSDCHVSRAILGKEPTSVKANLGTQNPASHRTRSMSFRRRAVRCAGYEASLKAAKWPENTRVLTDRQLSLLGVLSTTVPPGRNNRDHSRATARGFSRC